MATAQQVLSIAASQVGQHENPIGSNRTRYGEWYGMNGYPWCAMFVSYVLNKAGITDIRYASCDAGMAKFRSGEWGKWVPVTQKFQPGDIVFFGSAADSTHTGIVVADNGTTIDTIEGNTSSGDAGSQTNGDGVYRRRRPKNSWVVGCGRPDYTRPRPPKQFAVTAVKVNEYVVNEDKVEALVANLRERGFLVKRERVDAT